MTETRNKESFGQKLIESAREAVEIQRGKSEPARVTRYTVAETKVEAPPQYVAERIRGIRDEMALSQPIFAAALNVSPETVRGVGTGEERT